MKKRLLLALLVAASTLSTSSAVYAYTAGEVVTPAPSTPPSEPVEPELPVYEEYTVYTPKVTLLRNANALCAKAGDPIYYIPTLEDLPVDLGTYVTDCTDGTYVHKFAYVYDGYFNSDAELVTGSTGDKNTAQAYSSQNIETAYLANPTLKDIGYDLLLVSDSYQMSVKDGTYADITNQRVAANDSNLTAEQLVMDIYKALGIFEYDIKFCFTRDLDFNANASPILQEIGVLTSTLGSSGLDTTESRTDIAVSRTNPNLYWTRFDKDGIARKLCSDTTTASQILGLSTPVSRDAEPTYGQFCNLLVALMNLYGESALTENEYQACIKAYGADLASIKCDNKLEETSAIYLVAKGILDPEAINTISWDEPVRLLDTEGNHYTNSNTILDVLGRVVNVERRLTIKQPEIIDSTLSAAGYSSAEVVINPWLASYTEYASDANFCYDFLIEVTDSNKHVCTYTTQTVDVDSVGANVLEVSQSNELTKDKNLEYTAISNMQLFVNGNAVAPLKSLSDVFDFNTNGYYYYGVVSIDEKEYYRFKANKTLVENATLSVDYVLSENEVFAEGGDVNAIVLPNSQGGVYSLDDSGNVEYETFAQAGFTEEFRDATMSTQMQLASGNTTIIFYVTDNITTSALSDLSKDGFAWNNLVDNNGVFKFGQSIAISNTSDNMTTVIVRDGTAEEDYIRFEVTTNNPEAVKSSDFFTGYSDDTSYTTTGYYRASNDGSLMVSYSYLKDKGLVSGLKEVSDGVYVITAGKFKTNVTVLVDKDYIIVGDTMYPNLDGESLIVKTNNDTYINYRCCLGWAGQFSIVSTDDCVMAVPLAEFGINTTDIVESTVSVSTYFPSAQTKVLYNTLSYNGTEYSGISLAGSYALAPYLVVMTGDSTDYLFVWHRDKLVSTSGTIIYNVADDVDSAARDKFHDITGISLSKQDNYKLVMYTLNQDGSGVPRGFTFTNITKSDAKMTRSATMGWLYKPPEYNDVLKAIDEYASISSNLAIPIFTYKATGTSNGRYYDANLNVAAESSGTDYLPLGTMPSYLSTSDSSKEEYYSTLTSTGSYITTTSAGESTKAYPLYTAPVGLFAEFKGMGSTKAGDITAGTIYFGTAKCSVKDGNVTISNRATVFDAKSTATCTYLSNDSAAVYAVTEDSTTLGDVLKEADLAVGYLLDDPDNLVDWGQYKFSRLIQNLDSWSTVALIFVLNILPRVGLLLFFVLMLLSLIKNVKPWRMFCKHVVDVYKFLTLGHMDVDTIDTKRVCFISIICFSLFLMILDGQLFNFMIWIAKFFIALNQR